VLLHHGLHLGGGLVQKHLLVARDLHVVHADRDARQGGVIVAERLELVGQDDGRLLSAAAVRHVDEVGEILLFHHAVDLIERDLVRHHFVEENPTRRGVHDLPVDPDPDLGLQLDLPRVEGDPHLVQAGKPPSFTFEPLARAGQIVDSEDNVLRGADHGLAVRGREDVVGGHHEHPRLHLGLEGERDVNRHLVSVEVCVESGAHERVQLNRLPLDQYRLERLDPKPVERRGAVEHHRKLPDDLVQGVPDFALLLLHHLLGRLDGGRVPALLELVEDERLEQLEGHLLGQAALVQLQLRTDDDHRPAGVVHALSEQVLAEPPPLPLQHVREGLQRPLVGTGDELPATPVVEQGVDGFLQHPFLVPDDDLRGGKIEKPFQAVVPVDHTPVQVVQVRCGEPSAVQRNQGAKVRGEHGNDAHDHPLRALPAVPERLHDPQAFRDLLLFCLRGRFDHIPAEFLGQLVQGKLRQKGQDRLCAQAGLEGVAELLPLLPVLRLGEHLELLQVRLSGIDDDELLEVDDRLDLLHRHVDERGDAAGQALEEPDVGDGGSKLDVPHSLPAHLGLDHLDSAFFADDSPVFHPLVLSTVALVVLDRTENLRAEQTVPLRLEGAVIEGFRFFHLAVGPFSDLVRRRDGNADPREIQRVLRLLKSSKQVFQWVPPRYVP
jgi:hypothetical protein